MHAWVGLDRLGRVQGGLDGGLDSGLELAGLETVRWWGLRGCMQDNTLEMTWTRQHEEGVHARAGLDGLERVWVGSTMQGRGLYMWGQA